jgi:hypothetical protein
LGKHYVPRYYLKNFANELRIIVFDKHEKRHFEASTKNIAHETDMYSDETETFLANEIEEPAKSAIDSIASRKLLTSDQRVVLARYVKSLVSRVPAGRARSDEIVKDLVENERRKWNVKFDQQISQNSGDIELLKNNKRKINEFIDLRKRDRVLFDAYLREASNTKVPEFINLMNWRFLVVPEGIQLLTSDNPCFYFLRFGIANFQSEISLPISPRFALFISPRLQSPNQSFISVSAHIAKELNRRTIVNSNRFVFAKTFEHGLDSYVYKTHQNPSNLDLRKLN